MTLFALYKLPIHTKSGGGGGQGGDRGYKSNRQYLFHCNSQMSNIFAYACKDQPDIRYEQILTTCYRTCYYEFILFYYIISTQYHMLLLFFIKIVCILFSKNCSNMYNMLKYTTSTCYHMLLLFFIKIYIYILFKNSSNMW